MNGFTRTHRQLAKAAATTATIFLLMAALHKIPACPFCLSPPQTLAEQISRADIVLIAELLRFRVYDEGTRPESTLRIREYVRGAAVATTRRELAVGQAIVIAVEATGKPGDLFLMYGDLLSSSSEATATFAAETQPLSAPGDTETSGVVSAVLNLDSPDDLVPATQKTSLIIPEFITWNETLAVSNDVVSYLRKMPSTSIPQAKRLEYFLPHLEHVDPLVAIDAWAEFGNSSYNDVVAVRSLMSPEHLRAWIADPRMSPERLGLYGMMLGLSGTPADAEFLLRQMCSEGQITIKATADARKSFRFGAEGLMGGYLLLTGEPGLQHLEKVIVLTRDMPDTACHAFVQSLQFIWSYESDVVSHSRIQQSMRLLLKDESMREIAITNLSRWEDWETLSTLITMFNGECADDRSTQKAILHFAQACAKNSKTKAETREYANDAELFLCEVYATRPELLTSNVREFQAPQ